MSFASLLLILVAAPAVLSMYGPLEYNIGLSDNAKYYIMCQHNQLRSKIAKGLVNCNNTKPQPKAADMQCLCWSEELVPKAQKHASDCSGPPHDPRSNRSTANFPDVGQSLMDCLRTSPIDEALEAFYEEHCGYDFDSNTCDPEKAGRAKVCGHYTALAWAKTRALGCAYDHCEGHQNARLVCNYGPGGNIAGQKPYTKGEPCSQCESGQSCLDNSLCCSCQNGQCGGSVTAAQAGECGDKHPSCPAFKAAEMCSLETYQMFFKTNCRSSCGYCGSPQTNFCSVGFNISSDHCSVHSSENAKECIDGKGIFYTGKKNSTSSGLPCLAWATDSPSTNYYHSFEFPERNKAKALDYCRNPGGSGVKPWCYTTDTNVKWEYCDIPACT